MIRREIVNNTCMTDHHLDDLDWEASYTDQPNFGVLSNRIIDLTTGVVSGHSGHIPRLEL